MGKNIIMHEIMQKSGYTMRTLVGWFQWYCRYYMGRRIPIEYLRQIKRWKAMARHVAQIRNKCRARDASCNTRQRQALLHWAYNSKKL